MHATNTATLASTWLGRLLPSTDPGGWAFNPFAWQLLFVLGAWCALGGAKRMSRILASPESLTDEAIAVRHALYNDPALNAVQRRVTNAYFSDAVVPFGLTDSVLGAIRAPTLVYWGDKNPSPPPIGR